MSRPGSRLLLRLTAAAAVALAGTAHAPVAAAATTGVLLEHIDLTADGSGAVMTLQLSGPITSHLMRLHNPERVVLDLPGTRRHTALPMAPADSIITGVRSGVPDGQTLRLVLDLKTARHATLQLQTAGDGYQLRLVLGDATPKGPAARPGAQRTSALANARSAAASKLDAKPDAKDDSDGDDTSAPLTAVRTAHAPTGQRDIIVAVDAGHGGNDPGATGQSGTHEKDVTLAIARALAARINREPGMRAVLTRNGDYFVALRERMERAQAAHADMFVSIHADAVRDRDVSGASVYILSDRGATSEAARQLADQQNAADLKGGISLSDQDPSIRSILLDVTQSASIGESVEAADGVLGALDRVGAIRKHEVQRAAFVVLKSPSIPSMLIETAYISNPVEERRLCTPSQQQRLAEAIFGGVDAYFRKYPPEGSLYARDPGAPDAAASAAVARSGS